MKWALTSYSPLPAGLANLDYYANENADWDAEDNLMRLQDMHAQSFTPEMLGTCPIIGTPDDVADELPYFAQEVLPRLEAKGVRLPR